MRRSQALKIRGKNIPGMETCKGLGIGTRFSCLRKREEKCCWSIRKKQQHEEKLLIFSHRLFLEKLQKQGNKDPSNYLGAIPLLPLHQWTQQQLLSHRCWQGGRWKAQVGGGENRCKHSLLHLHLLQTPRASGSQPTENTSSWCWQFLRAYKWIPDLVKRQQTRVSNTGSRTFSSGTYPLFSPDTHQERQRLKLGLEYFLAHFSRKKITKQS